MMDPYLISIRCGITWEHKHDHGVQSFTQTFTLLGKSGVEIIEEKVEERNNQTWGTSHNVPYWEQRVVRAGREVKQAWTFLFWANKHVAIQMCYIFFTLTCSFDILAHSEYCWDMRYASSEQILCLQGNNISLMDALWSAEDKCSRCFVVFSYAFYKHLSRAKSS